MQAHALGEQTHMAEAQGAVRRTWTVMEEVRGRGGLLPDPGSDAKK